MPKKLKIIIIATGTKKNILARARKRLIYSLLLGYLVKMKTSWIHLRF